MPNFIPFDKDTACQIINIVNNRLTGTVEENDYAYVKVFSEMVDAMAHGKTSCVVHDYMYSKETKQEIREILECLGYTIEPYSDHLYADAMFRVIWRQPKKIEPVYGIPNIMVNEFLDDKI